VAPQDYQPKSGTLTFSPGQTNKSVIVPGRGDLLLEPNETFFENLTNPSNGNDVSAEKIRLVEIELAAEYARAQCYAVCRRRGSARRGA
jgi:hypothetical protein